MLWAMFGAGFGMFLFYRGFRMLRYKRLILNTPASKIRSAAMGLVELTGMTGGPHTIPAGITGEPCYFYRAIAWELRQSGNNRQWKQVANESVCLPFLLEDATGKVPVNPQGADLDLHCNFKDELGTSFFGSGTGMTTPSIALFLARNNVDMSRRIRLEEYCIKPGFPLWVMGTLAENRSQFQWTPVKHIARSSVIGSRSATHTQLNITGNWAVGLAQKFSSPAGSPMTSAPAPAPIVAGAAMQGGSRATARPAPANAVWSSVSADEIEMGRTSGQSETKAASSGITASAIATAEAEPQPIAPSGAETSSESHMPALVAEGPAGSPFIISWRSQKELVTSLAWKSALCIWGGPALTIVSFYVLARIFDWI